MSTMADLEHGIEAGKLEALVPVDGRGALLLRVAVNQEETERCNLHTRKHTFWHH